jgi:hypothetical protein
MPHRDVGEHDEGGRSTDRLLGELIAEVRALKHSQNNTNMTVEAVGRQTAPIPALVDQVKAIKEEQERQHFRIAVLEADKHRREGAIGLVAWLSRNWPFAFLSAVIAGLVAWANGKIS